MCGAVDLGWGLSIKLRSGGVRGEVRWGRAYGYTLTFHVSPSLSHSLSPCPSLSLFLSPISHPSTCVSQRFPWRPGGCGAAAAEEKEGACMREKEGAGRDGRLKCKERDRDTSEVIINQRHFED